MTKENCLKLLKAYEEQTKNGKTSSIRGQSALNYKMMKNHILNSKKFAGDPILKELQKKDDEKEDAAEDVVPPKEKKSKKVK